MKLSLSKDNWVSMFKGTLIAFSGAGIVYGFYLLSGMTFGIFAPLVVSILSIFVNYFRKVVEESFGDKEPTDTDSTIPPVL